MKKIFSYRRIYLLVLIPISILLILAARYSSFFAEKIYARHIYRFLSQIISTITGLLPFSLAEILVIALPVVILILAVNFILRLILDKENRKERVIKGTLNIFCSISILLFLFVTLTGINYYRYSFGEQSGLEIRESSVEELYSLTKLLIEQANELREQIPKTDEAGVFQLSMDYKKLAKAANQAFELLSEEYPVMGGSYGSAKPLILSEWMSRTETTGIFIPFTMEANVNVDIPDYNIPATMLHELAHLRGFMREDEANFLAYLAGMKSDEIEIRYSSAMLALVHAVNELYQQDAERYYQVRDLYSEGVILDFRANNTYWQQYEDTVISAMSSKINDTYLKVNDQSDGVQSYGRMLDLLLAEYRDKYIEE